MRSFSFHQQESRVEPQNKILTFKCFNFVWKEGEYGQELQVIASNSFSKVSKDRCFVLQDASDTRLYIKQLTQPNTDNLQVEHIFVNENRSLKHELPLLSVLQTNSKVSYLSWALSKKKKSTQSRGERDQQIRYGVQVFPLRQSALRSKNDLDKMGSRLKDFGVKECSGRQGGEGEYLNLNSKKDFKRFSQSVSYAFFHAVSTQSQAKFYFFALNNAKLWSLFLRYGPHNRLDENFSLLLIETFVNFLNLARFVGALQRERPALLPRLDLESVSVSTFLSQLRAQFNARAILEQFQDFRFLPRFALTEQSNRLFRLHDLFEFGSQGARGRPFKARLKARLFFLQRWYFLKKQFRNFQVVRQLLQLEGALRRLHRKIQRELQDNELQLDLLKHRYSIALEEEAEEEVFKARCQVCRRRVRGLFHFCVLCSHGGCRRHNEDWFDANTFRVKPNRPRCFTCARCDCSNPRKQK